MRHRSNLPHHQLTLDAPVTAVPNPILGLASLICIQVLVDSICILGHKPAFKRFGSRLLLPALARACASDLSSLRTAHLRRDLDAETVSGHQRRPQGLPFRSRSCRICALLFAVALAVLGLFFRHFMAPRIISIVTDVSPAADQTCLVIAELTGTVERIYVRTGASIHAGDAILQLDMRDLLLKKRRLESLIHSAELNRTAALTLRPLYSELDRLKVLIAGTTITSPADGVVTLLRPSEPRGTVAAGEAIAVVTSRRCDSHLTP